MEDLKRKDPFTEGMYDCHHRALLTNLETPKKSARLDDDEVGPAPPPLPEDDGMTDRQREIRKYIEDNDLQTGVRTIAFYSHTELTVQPETYDKHFLSKLLVNFEKAALNNMELRVKYQNEPLKYVFILRFYNLL